MSILKQAQSLRPQVLAAWLVRVIAVATPRPDAATVVAIVARGGRPMAWSLVRIPVSSRSRIAR